MLTRLKSNHLYVSEFKIAERMLKELFFERKPWALSISVIVILGTDGHQGLPHCTTGHSEVCLASRAYQLTSPWGPLTM